MWIYEICITYIYLDIYRYLCFHESIYIYLYLDIIDIYLDFSMMNLS